MIYASDGKFWVASKEAPILYLSLFLALARQAIPANAPPELINRMTYVGAYTSSSVRWRGRELRSSDPNNSLARKCKVTR
jgi:hypothetical protein